MRRFGALVLPLLLAGLACQGTTPTGELDEASRAAIDAEVRAAVDGMFAAMNAHDADRVLEYYVERDDFMYVGILNPEFGRGRLASMVREWVLADPAETVEHRIVHVQVLGPTVATVFSQGGFSSSGVESAWTQVLLRDTDGRWRIALEHEAWPSAEVRVRAPYHTTGAGEPDAP